MSKKTYDTLTTVSLFLIAASAILADRFSQYTLLFAGIAVSCTLVSTWIYFKHGMRKVREVNCDGNHQDAPAPETIAAVSEFDEAGTSLKVLHESLSLNYDELLVSAEIRRPDNPEDTSESIQPISGLFLDTLTALQVKSFYVSDIIVKHHQRTFAEEVVGIVKGLTEPGNPMYEFEFKPDGSFRVVPCDQRVRRTNEMKRQGVNLESMELQKRIH